MVKSALKHFRLLFLLLFTVSFAFSVFTQNLSRKQIAAYVKKIDKMQAQKKLIKYFYPNKSCGGALYGWYLGEELVFTHSWDGGYELENHDFMYIKNGEILKIVSKNYEYNQRRKLILKHVEKSYPTAYNDFECGEDMIKSLNEEKIIEK